MNTSLSQNRLLELEGIRKEFQIGPARLEILKGISFEVAAGELLAVMGTSGSGKSTLMNILGLLDRPSAGRYRIAGEDIGQLDEPSLARLRNERIGFVFQQFNLLPRLNARDNVALPLQYRGLPRREALARARAMLDAVGMGDRDHHRPNELSGGQQQRVAVARALVGEPSLILADEPTGALDSRVGQEIMEMFLRLHREQGTTVIIITHDPGIAAQCARLLRMRDGLLVEHDALAA
ncbi:ABC transporter ATP-binding protein [Thiocapsa marina]|uniref:Phosphonate-transporting ATPase n=1 Tax=Thiocapsa marina 5811 TaxID=768671 RepID=F9U6T3_9GAMM|nr:ABC transporter ATP-binding protein [Thiocapsa marina]EGV19959.1 Phosphonate-transporting ATPase [Thiocapsa marina 5811]